MRTAPFTRWIAAARDPTSSSAFVLRSGFGLPDLAPIVIAATREAQRLGLCRMAHRAGRGPSHSVTRAHHE